MKKTILILSILIITDIVALCSCEKSEGPNCTAMAKTLEFALNAYAADKSSTNCATLKDAYRDYLATPCIPSEQRGAAQRALETLESTCP